MPVMRRRSMFFCLQPAGRLPQCCDYGGSGVSLGYPGDVAVQ